MEPILSGAAIYTACVLFVAVCAPKLSFWRKWWAVFLLYVMCMLTRWLPR